MNRLRDERDQAKQEISDIRGAIDVHGHAGRFEAADKLRAEVVQLRAEVERLRKAKPDLVHVDRNGESLCGMEVHEGPVPLTTVRAEVTCVGCVILVTEERGKALLEVDRLRGLGLEAANIAARAEVTREDILRAERIRAEIEKASVADLTPERLAQLERTARGFVAAGSFDDDLQVAEALAAIPALVAAARKLGQSLFERINLADQADLLRAENERLRALINTPRTDDFIEALKLEAAHQIERWGTTHDAGKRPEDWIALLTYLLGKATKAHYDGDVEKLKHHIITGAAVALNWHRVLTGESTAMRPGVGPQGAEIKTGP